MENGFIDLTLRLGLPNNNYRQSYENPIHFRNSDLNSSASDQAIQYWSGLSEENSYFNISYNCVTNNTSNATSYSNSNDLGGQIITSSTNSNNNNNNNNYYYYYNYNVGSSARRASGNYHNNREDANRRCSNCGCGSNATPMWRRGPLGLKTLCNACGIRYRKEELKRKERENYH